MVSSILGFWGEDHGVIRTIMIGKYLSIQGLFIRRQSDGKIVIRDGRQVYVGTPVARKAG